MRWLHRRERIAWELEQLRLHGFEFEKPTITDEIVTLPVFVDLDGDRHRLEVDFFELFPYFRCEVRAPSLALDHHQHPFGKNLCLIPRPTEHWDVNRSLAAHLKEQLPKVLVTGWKTSAQTALDAEDPQAEPVTTYFPYEPSSAILFDGSWVLPPDMKMGRITVIREPDSRSRAFRGAVVAVASMANERLLEAPPHLARAGDRVEGYIVKLPAPILEADAEKLYEQVRRAHLHGAHEGKTAVIAVVMPEEHERRQATGDGWLFIVRERGKRPYFAHPIRAGEADLRARTPELTGLAPKIIVQFGLGCLGAPSAIEFAKAGVGALRLGDHDDIDGGTIVRWPLGFPAIGFAKTEVLAQFIQAHYPLTKVGHFSGRIGSTRGERDALLRMTEEASLIYDATAEPGVSYFLADLARDRGIPYVGVSGTQGGWGGLVVRLRGDGTTGCWYCLQRAKEEGLVPAPRADTRGTVQPAGCADPTFTGAAFDLGMIALTGVRIAAATLLEGTGGYPAAPSDITVIALRNAEGNLIQPNFTGINLPAYPDCPACRASGSP